MKYIVLFALGTLLRLTDWAIFLGLSLFFLVGMFVESLSFSFYGYFVQDYVSFRLICMTGWVVMFCLLSRVSEEWNKNSMTNFFLYIGVMTTLLLVRFSSLNFLVFYVSFEFVFVLIFIFVLG